MNPVPVGLIGSRSRLNSVQARLFLLFKGPGGGGGPILLSQELLKLAQ